MKLNDELVDKILINQEPISGNTKIEERIEFKKLLLTKHFVSRFNERLSANLEQDLDNLISLSKILMKNRGGAYYKNSFKEKRKNEYIFDTYLNDIPLTIVAKFDEIKDVYFAITVYPWLDEKVIDQAIKRHAKDQKDSLFLKEMREKFFKDLSEDEFFEKWTNYETLAQNEKKKFQSTITMKLDNTYNTLDLLKNKDYVENLNNIVIDNNPIEEESVYKKEKSKNRLGLTADDFPWFDD